MGSFPRRRASCLPVSRGFQPGGNAGSNRPSMRGFGAVREVVRVIPGGWKPALLSGRMPDATFQPRRRDIETGAHGSHPDRSQNKTSPRCSKNQEYSRTARTRSRRAVRNLCSDPATTGSGWNEAKGWITGRLKLDTEGQQAVRQDQGGHGDG